MALILCYWALTLSLSLLGTLINGYLVRNFQAEGMKHIGCVEDTDLSILELGEISQVQVLPRFEFVGPVKYT